VDIRFYNTLTKQVEPFRTETPGVVRMYSCGPTVYDFAHIGNFRSFLFADLLRRFLETSGYQVHHVMNITDVGHMTEDNAADGGGQDRMQEAISRMKESKKSGKVPEGAIQDANDPFQIAEYFTRAFINDGRSLAYKVAYEYPQKTPRATEHIAGMQAMIADLIERGHAYVAADGVVYFSVESFPDYGRLSGNTLEHLHEGKGGRVSDQNQAMKRHPADFMLWKPDSHHIMKWDSPWGVGYPGWHIECSVMARQLLGVPVIDIHTGGEDLIFPHHECEIAQSCGASGRDSFANFWIHARFLLVEGEKMSKSKGNFFTVRQLLDGTAKFQGEPLPAVHPAVLRYELLKAHYRSNMNFTRKGLQDSAGAVKRLTEFRRRLEAQANGQLADLNLNHPIVARFMACLADDLNIAGALAVVLPWANEPSESPAEDLAAFKLVNQVLNVAPLGEDLTDCEPQYYGEFDLEDEAYQEALSLCRELDEARQQKDFSKADQIRARLVEAGYDVKTTREGTVISL
jgi:cysteinyl-tRNA synthetase